ncbi:hypothetical protein [Vibrio sp. ECSMB14106]|nr:hypothetical protein [Vibrio sp. ECSMB14106]
MNGDKLLLYKSNENYHERSRLKQQWLDVVEKRGQLALKITALK